MENINNLLLVSTTSTKHEKLDNFAIKTVEGPFAIQTLHGIPKYFYTYKSKKITINQISPYKTIKTYTYKDEIIDLCFSSCGSYVFVMSSDKILVYNGDKQVAKIHGNFANCKIKSFHRTIVVVGNFNIFVFEQCNTENKFFEMTKDEDFEFGLKHKFIGNDCFVANHSILYSNNNALNMEVLGKFRLTIKYPLPIVKILCKTALSQVYCLCADEKVYKTVLDGTKSVTQIEESDVTDISFSFDEKYIIIGKKRSLHIYETSNDILVDEVFFDKYIEAYDCVLEVESAESLSPIKINK